MKYGNDLLATLVEEIPLLPRVSRGVQEDRHFQWFEIDFVPLNVEENALVLLGGQFQWRVVPFGHAYKTVFHVGAQVHPKSNNKSTRKQYL